LEAFDFLELGASDFLELGASDFRDAGASDFLSDLSDLSELSDLSDLSLFFDSGLSDFLLAGFEPPSVFLRIPYSSGFPSLIYAQILF